MRTRATTNLILALAIALVWGWGCDDDTKKEDVIADVDTTEPQDLADTSVDSAETEDAPGEEVDVPTDLPADLEDTTPEVDTAPADTAVPFDFDPDWTWDETLPTELPFELTRPASGTPPTAAEIETFTRKITGFWREMDFFRWCTWHSHGLHASYDATMPDYAMWWQDTRAIKAGDTVTFQHYGGADNLMIRTSKVLLNATAGFLASGDPMMRELIIGYSKGTVALFQGMVWGDEDPRNEGVTARAIFTHNHSYTTSDGRNVAVDYDPVKVEKYDWNAHTVPNPENPYFGDIWVRNMRSKDDVPHMYRMVPWLLRLVQETDDEEVRAAAQGALDSLSMFARDIVDNAYQIRTKEGPVPYVPLTEEGLVADLASFTLFDGIFNGEENPECAAKLCCDLMAYGQSHPDNDCDDGINPMFETIARSGHYFNIAIGLNFHIAAATLSLCFGEQEAARALLEGLVERCDQVMADEELRSTYLEADPDFASFLTAAAASGVPLTADEAHFVMQEFSASVDHYTGWPNWDLWDDSIPDGEHAYKPSRDATEDKHTRFPEMVYLIEYCASPWKNPTTVEMVDCEIVLDPSRWGE